MTVSSPRAVRRGDLDPSELSDYRRDGFVILRDLLNRDQVDRLSHECDRLLARSDLISRFNWRTRFLQDRNKNAILEKIDPVIDISPIFAKFACDPGVGTLARGLLETNEVVLFRDKLILKLPGFPGYSVHQDFSWWHSYDPHRMVTLAFAVDRCTVQNGAVEFFRGSHSAPLLPLGERRSLSDQELARIAHCPGVLCGLEAGEAVAFHSLAAHWSGPNLTTARRAVFYVSYLASGDPEEYSRQLAIQLRNKEGQLSPEERQKMYFK